MKLYKGISSLFILMALLVVGGCQGDESHAYHILLMKGMAEQVEAGIVAYDEKVADAEAAIQEIQILLADPNLVISAKEEMQDAIAMAVEIKSRFEGAKVAALEQVRAIKAKIVELEADGIQPGEDLIAFGEGVKNVGKSLPAPVGPILLLVGGVIGAIGEMRKRKSDKIARGVVASVDTVLELEEPNHVGKIKTVLKDKQRELGVREGVKKLLDT